MIVDRTYAERPSAVLPATLWRAADGPGTAHIHPDGCMDLIWNGQQLQLAGPDVSTVSYQTDRPTVLTAIRFRPGVAPVLLGCPADKLVNARIDLAELWPAATVRSWVAELAQASDPAAALERLAAQRLSRSGGVPAWLPPTAGMLAAGLSVAAVADRIGASPRQLQRRARWHFGYGPKTLQRILRVKDAVRLLRAGGELSDVAHQAGFADYSHMFRDLRQVVGEPPAAFRPNPIQPSGAKKSTGLPSGSLTTAYR